MPRTILLALHPLKRYTVLINGLKKKFLSVLTVDNGRDAVKMIGNHAPDLVCATVKLPRLSSVKLAQTLRNSGSLSRFILIYPGSMDQNLSRAVQAGADRIVTGRVEMRKLAAVIRDLFREPKPERKSLQTTPGQTDKDELRRKNKIEQDLRNAQTIQRALLPRLIPDLPQLRIDYRYVPMESVGGDYFSFTILREGGLGVFLGDVTGHGVSAALFLALVKAFTDRACRRYGQKPREYLVHLNRDLMDNMTTNFLTAVYAHFTFGENGVVMTFAKGGHPPPMIYRAATGSVDMLESEGTILGVIASLDFEQKTATLCPGDRLFLFTDGVHETTNRKNEMFGLDGVKDLLSRVNDGTLSESLDGMIRGLKSFRGLTEVRDDIVILGFEARSPDGA